MTDSDEELRVFGAGHLVKEGKLIIRQNVPLFSCLRLAIEGDPTGTMGDDSVISRSWSIRLAEIS